MLVTSPPEAVVVGKDVIVVMDPSPTEVKDELTPPGTIVVGLPPTEVKDELTPPTTLVVGWLPTEVKDEEIRTGSHPVSAGNPSVPQPGLLPEVTSLSAAWPLE